MWISTTNARLHAVLLAYRFTFLTLLRQSRSDFIEDPRHLFEVKQPESQMVEVVINVLSALLTMCWALVQSQPPVSQMVKVVIFFVLLFLSCVCCNVVVVQLNIYLSINAKAKRNSATVACHWIEENNKYTMAKSLSQTDNCSGSYRDVRSSRILTMRQLS